MPSRSSFIARPYGAELYPVEGLDRRAVVALPVNASGDINGAVLLLENDAGVLPRDTDIKLAEVAAGFLGKQMEE